MDAVAHCAVCVCRGRPVGGGCRVCVRAVSWDVVVCVAGVCV